MAADSKDVELRIRARDYSQKTLDEVVNTLRSLADAQEDQLQAAKRGEVSAKALEESYRKLESAAKALLSQEALIRMYQTQAKTLEEVKVRVEAARQAQSAYERSLDGATACTSRQNAELNKLSKAVAAAERAQVQAEGRIATTSERLSRYGIESSNAAQAQERIRAGVSLTNRALERQDDALSNLQADLRSYRTAQEQADAASRAAAQFEQERAKNLRRLQEGEVNNLWQGLLAEREAKERQAAEAAAARAAQQQAADEQAAAAAREAIALAHDQAIAEDKARAAAKKEAEAREAQRAALNKAADEVEALARGYETLGRSVRNVRGDVLSKQIKAIVGPTGEATKTLQELASALNALEAKTQDLNGPVSNYGATLKELTAIQKSLIAVAGQVDAYQRQMDAVRSARTEFAQARQEVLRLAQQMRSGKGDTSQLTAEMTRAQSALRSTSEAMRRQTQTARDMRGALREASVDTRNLAAAEQSLIAEAQRAVTVTHRLTEAFKKHGEAADKTRGKLKKFTLGERTTLSFFQRMRGEVLALTTAFVGVQAAVSLATGALAAYRSKQAIESRLAVMVGNDAKAIKEEWDYLMAQAERLGFGFETLAMSYSKFGVAAKQTGLTTQETRFIFERMAEAARVARMSTDDFEGSLKAIEQMISKGSIQAEELRQQLGDRLPGAMAIAAKGAGVTIAEFTKMMETGQVGAEFVINMARQLGVEYSKYLDEAVKGLAAVEGNLETALYKFREATAENGFVQAYRDFIKRLTEILNSQQGQQLAQTLANGFAGVVAILQWCAEHVNILIAAFAALLGLGVFRWIMRFIGMVRNAGITLMAFRAKLTAASGAMGFLTKAAASLGSAMGLSAAGVATLSRAVGFLVIGMRALLRAIPVIGAALLAYDLYSVLTANAEKAGEGVGKKFVEGMAKGVRGANSATGDPFTGGSLDSFVEKAIGKTLGELEKRTEKADRRTRMKGAKGELQERLDIAAEEYEKLAQQAKENIKDEKTRADTLTRIEKAKNEALRVEQMKFEQEQAATATRGGNHRIDLARQVADELKKIEDELAKQQTRQDPTASFDERMQTRIAAVAHEYDKLAQRIDKLAQTNRAAAADAKVQLEGFVKQRQEVERVKVTQEEMSRLGKAINDQMSLRNTLIERAHILLDQGAISAEQAAQDIADAYRKTSEEITKAANALRDVTEKSAGVIKPEVRQENLAKADIAIASNDPRQSEAAGGLLAIETEMNRLLGVRNQLLSEIQARKEQGLLTDAQAAEASNAVIDRFRGAGDAALEKIAELDTALRNLGMSPDMLDPLVAKIRELAGEVGNAQVKATDLQMTIANSVADNATNAIDSMAQSMANLVTGQESASEAFAEIGSAAALAFAQMLRDIALYIIKTMMLKAIMSAMGIGPIGGGVGGMAAGVSHAGGVAGRGTGTRTRTVSPFVFAGAERFHGGGLPGLRSNEIPTILEEGEEVLDRNNPRNILNGGAAAGGGGDGSNRFVLVDDRAKMAEAMAGAEGEQVTMVHLRRNIPTLRQWMK